MKYAVFFFINKPYYIKWSDTISDSPKRLASIKLVGPHELTTSKNP